MDINIIGFFDNALLESQIGWRVQLANPLLLLLSIVLFGLYPGIFSEYGDERIRGNEGQLPLSLITVIIYLSNTGTVLITPYGSGNYNLSPYCVPVLLRIGEL
jgi:hypothetical protein